MDNGSRQESADNSSKQNNGSRERPSLLHPSLSLQAEIGMGGPHSLLAMYVSAEKQTLDHIWYQGWARHKKHVNFQTTEISQLPFIHHRVRHIVSCRLVITGWRRIRNWLCLWKNQEHTLRYERNPNSKIMPCREKKKLIIWMNSALRGMVSLVKRIPKQKTCPRGKEQ